MAKLVRNKEFKIFAPEDKRYVNFLVLVAQIIKNL